MSLQKPIKRSKELTPLSRDHHDGLLLCWKIREGLKHNIATERITAYVLAFYENELLTHFKQEEDLVFCLLKADDNMKQEALRQHDRINSIYETIKHQTSKATKDELLIQFEKELNEHIRFEERELFPYIEKIAVQDMFTKAGKQIDDLHQKHECLVWHDEFWTMKK